MILFELKRAILESGLKQTFIARQIGMDATIFSKKVHGYIPIAEEEKKRVARVIGRDVHELFSADSK